MGMEAVREILKEFRGVGFAEIEVPAQLTGRLLELARSFYAKPLNERMVIGAFKTRTVLGYYPSEVEAKSFTELSGNRIPVFDGHRARGYSSFDYIANDRVLASSELFKANQWPPGDGDFRREACELYDILGALMKKLSVSILDELRHLSHLQCSWTNLSEQECCCIMRVLKYATYGQEMESKSHTDYEFISFIYSDTEGLQVKAPSGDWIVTPCGSSKAIILPGDMLETATGGWVQSVHHRVRFGLDERLAVIFFQGLGLDQRIDYPSFHHQLPSTFGDHLCGMLIRGSAHLSMELSSWEEKLGFRIPATNPFRENKK